MHLIAPKLGPTIDLASIKVLFFDGTGICLFYKRLDKP